MAKKHFVSYSNMTKKQKFLNFLKIFAFSFAGVAAIVGGVVLYVWLKGDLIPGPVPLTEIYFASSEVDAEGKRSQVTEYVIDGNKEILVEMDGSQAKDQNGNLVWVQKTDQSGEPLYNSIFVGANEGCTELDAVLTIDYHSHPTSPIIQVIEDDNCSPINKDETDAEKLYYSYNVKINSPIYIKPLTQNVEINGAEVEANIGGWVKITITQGQLYNSCWVFVDDPILNFEIKLDTTKFEKDESFDEENGYYNVYSNSKININQIFSPSNSLILPSTNVPQAKGSTGFSKSKTITYRILPDKIASIDSDGNISIEPNREGETFSVQAYVIAKYNDIGHEPNIEDYEGDPSQDPTVPYNKAFDKIRVFSNTITFKINEITVQGISVKAPTETPSFDVFENGYITHSNTISDSTKTNYLVNLALTNEEDTDYKATLLSKVKLFVGKAQDIVSEKPVALSESDFVVWDADINRYRKLVDASSYMTLTKTANNTYHYVVNNYSDDNFYFVFYYELGEDQVTEILYDATKFTIKENAVNKIDILSKQNGDVVSLIKLRYNDIDDFEAYSITDNLNINLTGKDPSKKPTYSYIMYLVPEDNGIINTYSGDIKAKIGSDNKICVPIYAEVDGEADFTKVVPIGTGTTKLYVAVVKTTTEYTGQSDVEFVYTPDGFVDIELQSSVTVEITSSVQFTSLNYDETESKNVERAVLTVDEEDPEYYFAQDCQLFAEVYEEGKIQIVISYVGDDDAIKNNRLQIVRIYGTEDIARESLATIPGEDGLYSFPINALDEGYAKFQVLYDGEDVYKIGIKVLSTKLVGLTVSTKGEELGVNNELNVSFSGEYGATEYSWNNLALDIYYNSPKTEAKSFELKTYNVPALFDETFLANFEGENDDERLISLISLYQGKNYTEVIDNAVLEANGIETLKKLREALLTAESDDILKIYNNSQVDESLVDAGITIFDAADSSAEPTNYKFKVMSIGKVLVLAQSGDVYSNPIIIETKCPEIKIIIDDNEIENILEAQIYAHAELTSIDNKTTAQNQQNLLMFNGKQINFVAIVDDQEFNINNLMIFGFENQSETNETFISTDSGATIAKEGLPILTVGDIKSAEIVENILVDSEFGYKNNNFCHYTIISDYKLNNKNATSEYNTPANVNLFKGTSTDYPQIVVTNAEYNFENMAPTSPNKLYLPSNFNANNINDLLSLFPENFLASFYYADPEVEDPTEADMYYHIYKVLTISNDGNNAQNYIVFGQNGEIELQYKKSAQSINVFVKTFAGQNFSTGIKVKPGATANFGNGYIVNTEMLSGDPIEIAGRLIFQKNDGFEANITDVDFAVNALTNDNLTFYYVTATEKRLETFVEVLPENVVYITEAEYNTLDDAEKVGYKMFYILTSDVSSLTEGKTYYQKVNGEFVVVDNPVVEDLEKDIYFEKVYSNKTYYGEETYYQAIENAELNNAYKDKYYEAVYKLTTDTEIVAGKDYFTLSGEVYIIVETPNADDLSSYYEVNYQKTSDANVKISGKTYYYKMNYKEIVEGKDITNVYDKLVLTLELEKDLDNYVTVVNITYDNVIIKNITSSIDFTLNISAKITNTESHVSTTFTGLYFNVTLQ